MRKLNLSFVVILITFFAVNGQVDANFYVVDTQHSIIDFKIRHIGFSNVRGSFLTYEGNIFFDPTDIKKTSASIVIKVESLETGAGGRNGVLKNEFFQVDKYPNLVFTSKRVIIRDQHYMVGDLTIGAVTKEVEIPFVLIAGPVIDQWKNQRITLSGELTIDRKDFGIYYRGNDFWDNVVEDKVNLEIEVGARVYKSMDTVYPFRETSIGRMSFEGYVSGGKAAAKAKMQEALADPEKYSTSYSQMVRGAGHLMDSGNTAGAIELLELGLEVRSDMPDDWKSEFLARKGQYLIKTMKYDEAKSSALESLKFDKNPLAMEVLKWVNTKLN
jgi:polyisoprenoid-binding protein YceI